MRGPGSLVAMLGLLGSVGGADAQPAGSASSQSRLDLRALGVSLADGATSRETAAHPTDPPGEVTWRVNGLNLGMREEDGRLKGDLFVERGSWRLGVRPTTGGGALATDGIMLRFSTRLD